jgi:hypothetical protein
VENKEDLSLPSLKKEYASYDMVSILINRKIEILKYLEKENVDSNVKHMHLRIIAIDDLTQHMVSMENTHINYHIKQGLPKTVDKNAVISMVYPKDFMHKKLHYYVFEKLKDKESIYRKSDYDITQYMHNAPSGFSLWMTIDEMKCVDNFKKTKSKPKNEVKVAKPRKDHNFCQICNVTFNDYDEVYVYNLAYSINDTC